MQNFDAMSFKNYFCRNGPNLGFPSVFSLFSQFNGKDSSNQCDQIKIAKCLQKLPKNDFTRKMNDFDSFTKIA